MNDGLYVGCWVKGTYGQALGQVLELDEESALVDMYRKAPTYKGWELIKLNHQYRYHRKAVKLICRQDIHHG